MFSPSSRLTLSTTPLAVLSRVHYVTTYIMPYHFMLCIKFYESYVSDCFVLHSFMTHALVPFYQYRTINYLIHTHTHRHTSTYIDIHKYISIDLCNFVACSFHYNISSSNITIQKINKTYYEETSIKTVSNLPKNFLL